MQLHKFLKETFTDDTLRMLQFKGDKSISHPCTSPYLKKTGDKIRLNLKDAGYAIFKTSGYFLDVFEVDGQKFLRVKITLKGMRTDLSDDDDLLKVNQLMVGLELDCIQYFDSDYFTNLIFWKSLDKEDTNKDKHDT